jgi:hypothetical protein
MTLVPDNRGIPLTDQLVVPEAVPDPPRSFDHVALEMSDAPSGSDAVPPRLIGDVVVEYVGLLVGEVIVTTGGWFGGV